MSRIRNLAFMFSCHNTLFNFKLNKIILKMRILKFYDYIYFIIFQTKNSLFLFVKTNLNRKFRKNKNFKIKKFLKKYFLT